MHNHDHGNLEKNSFIVAMLNLVFVFIEIAGGLFTNSIAILSDAIHDLGDVISLIISYILIKASKKDRNLTFSYGYKRFIIIGALINVLVLSAGSIYVYMHAIERLIHPEEVNGIVTFLLAILGVTVNGYGFFKFSHSDNVMTRTLKYHLLEDLLGWISVLISGLAIYFLGFYRIDSILAIVIATIILYNALRNLKKIIDILINKTPKNISILDIKNLIEQERYVLNVHDIRVWTLDGETNVFTAHLIISDELSLEQAIEVKDKIKEILKNNNCDDITLEIETNKSTRYHEKLSF